MPEEIQTILEGYYSCESRSEAHGWEIQTAYKITEFADQITPGGVYYTPERANCPLCGDSGSNYYTQGFSIPEGLFRHLIDTYGARQCRVFGAMMKLARDHWNREFRAKEEAEFTEKREREKQRRATEILYKVSPFGDPDLIYGWSGDSARNDDSIEWAEKRLADLGFKMLREDRIKSYVNDQENFIVYADLRRKGELKFEVFKKPLSKTKKHIWGNDFVIRDEWKHDLQGKYQKRLEQTKVFKQVNKPLIHEKAKAKSLK